MALVEGTETVPITLSMPVGAATLGAQTTTMLQIQDVAPPASVVQFTSSAFSSVLGQDKQITLGRTGALGSPLSVNVTVTGGTAVPGEDFSLGEVANRTVVNFGPTDTTASFTVTTREPGGGDPDLTAIFGLSIPTGTGTLGTLGTTTLTLLGSASDLNLDLSVYSVTEGGGPAIITVTRRGNLNRQVSASFATSNGTAVAGTHYTAQSGTIIVPAGESTATFTVPILSNGPGDGTRTVNLTLSNPSPNTTLGEGDSARLEIREGPVYTFQRIAETDDRIGGFDGAPGINDAGTVAFKALVTDAQQQQQLILTGNGGALTTVAATGEGFVEFGTRIPIDNNGQVAFLASLQSEAQAVFRGDEENLTQVAITNAQLIQLFDPALSGNGTLAFAGQMSQVPAQNAIQLFAGSGSSFPLRRRHRRQPVHQSRHTPSRERRRAGGLRRDVGAWPRRLLRRTRTKRRGRGPGRRRRSRHLHQRLAQRPGPHGLHPRSREKRSALGRRRRRRAVGHGRRRLPELRRGQHR